MDKAKEFAYRKSIEIRRPVRLAITDAKPQIYSSEVHNSWLYYRTFEERRVDLIAALEFNHILDMVVIPKRVRDSDFDRIKLNVRLQVDQPDVAVNIRMLGISLC